MKRSLALFAPALALLLAAGTGAHAAPLYTYDFTPDASDLAGLKADNSAAGQVNVINTPAVSNVNGAFTNVTALNWGTAVNTGFENQVLHLTGGDPNNNSTQGTFIVRLALTDQALLQDAKDAHGGSLTGVDPNTYSRVLTFKGSLSGTWGVSTDPNGNKINPFSNFPSANPLSNPIQTATLGNWDYLVDLSNYIAPPNPLNLTPGGIGGFIKVTAHSGGGTDGGNGGGGPGVQTTPEPSTMLLSCLGLSLVGAASWRKRRQAAPAAA